MLTMLKDKEFLKRFFKVSFPVMLHAFILFIVNFIDNIMVGSLSNESVGGVYAANQATYILMIAGYGVIIGAGIFMQQFNGANDEEHMRQAFRYKIIIMILFTMVSMIIYYTLGKHLVWFYCHSDPNSKLIYQEGIKYLNIIILSYIPYCLSMIYTTTVREIGQTKYALIAGALAFLLNIIFNSIFIYGFNMGVVGAALGTIIARVVELIVIVYICHKKKFSFCKKIFSHFKIEKKLFYNITKKGSIFLLNELFWVFGMTLLSLAYSQRSGVLSALSVVNSISNLFNIIFQGLSIGIGVLVGSYLGQSKFDEAKDYTKKVYYLGFLLSLIFGILIVIFSPIIPNMFKEIADSQKSLATTLLIIYGSYIWIGCLYTCCYMTLKTGGKAITTILIDSGLTWVISVPVAWFLVLNTNVNLLVIYGSILSVDLIKFIFAFIFIRRGTWLKNLTKVNLEV